MSFQPPGLAPDPNAEIKRNAQYLLASGDARTAITILETALRTASRDPDLLSLLGTAHYQIRGYREAIRRFNQSLAIRPNHALTLSSLAWAHQSVGEIGQAHRAVDRVLAVWPTEGQALDIKARLLIGKGDTEAAYELIEPAISAGIRHSGLAVCFADLCVKHDRPQRGIDLLRPLLEDPHVELAHRRNGYYVLGRLYDKLDDFDAAFNAYKRGNDMYEHADAFDADKFIEAWSREFYEALPRAADDSRLPVLVVGMPRSGTTLTEQMLASHPQGAGVGESTLLADMNRQHPPETLDEPTIDDMGRRYLDMLKTAAGKKTRRVVDKMPGNFRLLGLATAITPGVSIIHAVRDPRDTCLSCYFQNFGMPLGFSNKLETCADEYLSYRKTIAHWQRWLDRPIFESRYEELVTDPEPALRRMLDHIGLPFDERCLAFHQARRRVQTASVTQVREKIYTRSAGRWKHYEKHIGPMLERLARLDDLD